MRQLDRHIVITGGVVLFHVAALWALNTGLRRRAVEVVVPVQMLSEMLSPPAPRAQPQPPGVRQPVARKVERSQRAAPRPLAIPQPEQAVDTGSAVPAPVPAAPAVSAAVTAPPAAAPAPARVELPSSDADYLQNPKPAYPPLSRRLGEQGKVMLRVLIGADGAPQKAEVLRSSGFERLDQAAVNTVLKWRFVPGKRGGIPETAWAQVPINFVLE